MFPDDPFTQGLRRRTLASLHVNPNAASDWNPDVPLAIDPEAAHKWQPPAPVQPAQPKPVQPDTSFNPNLDLQLGFQSGMGDLTNMLYKPAEGLYGGRVAGDKPLSQAVSEEVGPDPNQLAGRTQPFQHAMQFAGRTLPDVARYGLATAATAGDPILGAAAADALKADTPGQAVTSGLASAAMTGLMHNVPEALAEYGPRLAKDAISMLPTREELQAAGEAANARLQQSGMYSGATAPMGKFLDPATIRDMAITSASSLGSGVYSAAERAAAMSRQIQELIRRPAPVEAAAEAPVRDVLARSVEDLERRIPNEQRVVSTDPTKLINGQPFSSLDMNAPSEGYLPFVHLGAEEANHLNDRMWLDSIKESELPGGSAAMEAVRRTGARPPTAEFLHRSMQLPQRARYWYELSGNSFTGDHIDIPREMQPGFIDNVAATSGGAKPYTNMKRALGTYAENLQNVPIYTDLRDPASVRNALNPELDRLGTHKYQNFSGTMQYTSGLDNRPPLSVNDVQMADIFGIKGSDIGKNPALYEVLSRYTNKVRDAQNALMPEGGQPWETWQVQAPTWVQNRLDKDPKSTYDDYAMVLPRITKELNDAGIETPGGKISLETMMDPRFPNVMSGTRENFMGTPVGTVEFATTKTPAGAAATQMRSQLEQYDPNIPWVRDAKAKYEQIQRNAMTDFAMRHGDDPSLVSQLMSHLTGQKLDTSRLEWNGYGTYEGDINPNLRIPMGGTGGKGFVQMDKPQREAFLSILGQDLNQDGMAASHFTTVPHAEGPPSADRTFSVFMRRYDNQVDQNAIQEFSRQLGYPVNVSRTPNGVLVDVNIADKGVGPTLEAVSNASDATFGRDGNVHDLAVVPRAYDSDFVHNSNYQEKIDAQNKINKPGRSGRAGNPTYNVRNLKRIRQAIQRIAQNRDAEFAEWTQAAQARAAKLTPPQP
ncbi:MAG TPA: hypothetical protein VNW90_25260 [Acetobacteraceae bacterium]|jgi:hypothetical protein|nr:hypothetical protein [Acetobacteraceae bacterium]